MKKMESDSRKKTAFKQLINVLEYNLKAFKSADSSKTVVELYDQLIKHLKSINYNDFQKILNSKDSVKALPKKKSRDIITDEEAFNLTNNEIMKIVSNKETTRKTIEKIAMIKFGMRESELKSIRDKKSLREHLYTIIRNQETHESIRRAASLNGQQR